MVLGPTRQPVLIHSVCSWLSVIEEAFCGLEYWKSLGCV